jgi:hypothetical protein
LDISEQLGVNVRDVEELSHHPGEGGVGDRELGDEHLSFGALELKASSLCYTFIGQEVERFSVVCFSSRPIFDSGFIAVEGCDAFSLGHVEVSALDEDGDLVEAHVLLARAHVIGVGRDGESQPESEEGSFHK